MNFKQALDACRREIKYQKLGVVESSKIGPLHIPCLMGGVGLGKTTIGKQLSMEEDLTYIPINCGEATDGTDMTGVPFPSRDDDGDVFTTWAPNRQLYTAVKQPGFLHFDDCDKALRPAQNALIGICGERMFRDTQLHSGTVIFLSGNRTEDDKHALALTESIRTRITTIHLEPDVVSFSEWGTESGLVHPILIGYVNFKPDHLHVISPNDTRDTTPRGYREASDQMFGEDSSIWKEIWNLKLGSGVANDLAAYYEIYSKVDVDHVMAHGTAKAPPHQKDADGNASFDPNNENHMRRFYYAALFAVSHALNKGKFVIGKKTTPGLSKFIKDMQVEMRVAFLVQLSTAVRAKLSNEFEAESALLATALVT